MVAAAARVAVCGCFTFAGGRRFSAWLWLTSISTRRGRGAFCEKFGVTGERATLSESLSGLIEEVRSVTALPLAAGFGISTPEQAAQVAQGGGAAPPPVGTAPGYDPAGIWIVAEICRPPA